MLDFHFPRVSVVFSYLESTNDFLVALSSIVLIASQITSSVFYVDLFSKNFHPGAVAVYANRKQTISGRLYMPL